MYSQTQMLILTVTTANPSLNTTRLSLQSVRMLSSFGAPVHQGCRLHIHTEFGNFIYITAHLVTSYYTGQDPLLPSERP